MTRKNEPQAPGEGANTGQYQAVHGFKPSGLGHWGFELKFNSMGTSLPSRPIGVYWPSFDPSLDKSLFKTGRLLTYSQAEHLALGVASLWQERGYLVYLDVLPYER